MRTLFLFTSPLFLHPSHFFLHDVTNRGPAHICALHLNLCGTFPSAAQPRREYEQAIAFGFFCCSCFFILSLFCRMYCRHTYELVMWVEHGTKLLLMLLQRIHLWSLCFVFHFLRCARSIQLRLLSIAEVTMLRMKGSFMSTLQDVTASTDSGRVLTDFGVVIRGLFFFVRSIELFLRFSCRV